MGRQPDGDTDSGNEAKEQADTIVYDSEVLDDGHYLPADLLSRITIPTLVITAVPVHHPCAMRLARSMTPFPGLTFVRLPARRTA